MEKYILDSPILNKFSEIHLNLLKIVKDSNEINEGDLAFLHKNFQGDNVFHWYKYEDLILESNIQKQKNLAKLIDTKRKALEIGFNAGHSTAIMLNYEPNVHVTVIDICEHKYTKPCYEYLNKVYPNRITFIEGNSTIKIKNLKHEYDFIHIDGCHDPIIAKQDIENSNKILEKDGIILLDDTQDEKLEKLGDELLSNYINLGLECKEPLAHQAYMKL
jgi:hypothetical protein